MRVLLAFWSLFSIGICYSQVGIGTTTLEDGVMLQLESEDKGLLIPNVELTSINDVTTILPSNVEGLLVYNTATTVGSVGVSPGFYNWDGSRWRRLFNSGFSTQFFQTTMVHVQDQNTEYILPGLNQDFVAPYSGLYQFIFIGYYATGSNQTNLEEAASYASFMLEIDNERVAECFVSSRTMSTTPGGYFQALSRQGMFIHQVELVEGVSYNLKVKGREWNEVNSGGNIGLGTGFGYFDLSSNLYSGSRGRTNATQSSLTINLLQQY